MTFWTCHHDGLTSYSNQFRFRIHVSLWLHFTSLNQLTSRLPFSYSSASSPASVCPLYLKFRPRLRLEMCSSVFTWYMSGAPFSSYWLFNPSEFAQEQRHYTLCRYHFQSNTLSPLQITATTSQSLSEHLQWFVNYTMNSNATFMFVSWLPTTGWCIFICCINTDLSGFQVHLSCTTLIYSFLHCPT